MDRLGQMEDGQVHDVGQVIRHLDAVSASVGIGILDQFGIQMVVSSPLGPFLKWRSSMGLGFLNLMSLLTQAICHVAIFTQIRKQVKCIEGKDIDAIVS